ncbi:hypothetical protein GCM10027289_27780 [Tsukamurella serpentis]
MTWLFEVLQGVNGFLFLVLAPLSLVPLLVHDRRERRAGR